VVSCVRKLELLSKFVYYLGSSSLCQGIIMVMLASEFYHMLEVPS